MATIALVEPRAPQFNVYSFASLPRLGLPSIGTVLRDLGHQVTVYCQGLRKLPMAKILKADLVGISTTTSTAPEAYRLADLCRSRGIPVLIGGVHATFCSEEASQHADYCLRGEAEETIGDVVEQMLAAPRPYPPEGLTLRLPEKADPASGVCRVADLDRLPIPDLSLIQGWSAERLTPMMTSRGCPFDCNFCSVTPMFGKAYRFRSTELVLEELAARQPRSVFFYDDNFAANPKRTRELLEGMIRLPHPPHWVAQVRADVAQDRELVALMQASGCVRVFIGYESVSPATLAGYGKRLSIEQSIESARILREHNIRIHGMFVLGSDEDEVPTIRDTARFALRNALDTVQFAILTPLPGTKQFQILDRAKRIFTRDWSLYDGHHTVFEPLQMTAAALQREVGKAHRRFYSSWRGAKAFAGFRFRDGLVNVYAQAVLRLAEARDARFRKALAARESLAR